MNKRLRRNGMMKKMGLSLLLNLEADNAKIVQPENRTSSNVIGLV
jgi:hypothetical protein